MSSPPFRRDHFGKPRKALFRRVLVPLMLMKALYRRANPQRGFSEKLTLRDYASEEAAAILGIMYLQSPLRTELMG